MVEPSRAGSRAVLAVASAVEDTPERCLHAPLDPVALVASVEEEAFAMVAEAEVVASGVVAVAVSGAEIEISAPEAAATPLLERLPAQASEEMVVIEAAIVAATEGSIREVDAHLRIAVTDSETAMVDVAPEATWSPSDPVKRDAEMTLTGTATATETETEIMVLVMVLETETATGTVIETVTEMVIEKATGMAVVATSTDPVTMTTASAVTREAGTKTHESFAATNVVAFRVSCH